MRCVVLGAGGFIGINLCKELIRQSWDVRAFGRCQSYTTDIEWITGDFSDAEAVENAINGCDIVFHLITATTPASANIDKIRDVNLNVLNTLHMLDACVRKGVRRVVFVSSGGTVYGIPDQVPTPETASTNPITAYGISKLSIEKYLGLYEYLYGLEYRILRVANPFGPHQSVLKNQGVIAAFLARILDGKPIEIWGDGSVTRDYIYINDVIEALMLAAKHEGYGRIFNVGSGEGRTLNEIIYSIKKLIDIPISVEYHPGRALDVPVSILDNSFSKNNLGWSACVNFEYGLSQTIEWMLHNRK